MSYTSKYTGPEIDSLLDKIGSTSFNETVLFEGKYLIENDTMSEKNILNNNIKNYDYIALVTAQEVPSGEYAGWLVRQNTIFVDVSTALTENIGSTVAIWCSNFGAGTGTTGYTVTGNFGDGTQIGIQWITKQSGVSDRKHYVLKVVGLKLSPAASSAVSSNPIGSIIPVIGMEAPKDYIICDGKELNIVDYPELADYFEKQFSTKNHFGGDGISTFAIPDLRNEFLRGYHGDAELQLSGEIGEHQEGTVIPHIAVGTDKQLWTRAPSEMLNTDKDIGTATSSQSNPYNSPSLASTAAAAHTIRPTNIAVLFCIKYTESGANSRGGYKEVELLSSPVEYDMTYNVLATIGKDLVLNDDIANYNEVVFLVEIKNTVNEAYLGLTNIRMLTSEIIYSNDNTASVSGSSFYLTLSHGTNNSELNYWRHCTAGVHFKTGTTLRVRNTITNTSNYTKFRIKAIKGIKY